MRLSLPPLFGKNKEKRIAKQAVKRVVKQVVENPIKPNSLKEETHKHEWELISKTYAPPNITVSPNGQLNTQDKELVERLTFGVTNLLFQCVLCKDFHKEEMLGSDEDTLGTMVQKVESYGPQYFQRENNTYVVARYVVPNQSGNLPVR